MAVSFILREAALQKASINIIIHVKNNRYRRTTDIKIEPARWNPKTQQARDIKGYESPKVINLRLRKMREVAEALVEEISTRPNIPTPEEFWRKFNIKLDGTSTADKTFTEYLGEYAARRKGSDTPNTAKQYLTTYNKMLAYESHYKTKVHFADINLQFYEKLKKFILAEGYNLNYFGMIIKCLKVAYRDARDVDELHSLHETEKRGFSSVSHVSKSVYLSVEELQRIADVKITPATILAAFPDLKSDNNFMWANLQRKADSFKIIRNKFILGAFTALRVSDFNHLENIHIAGDYFRITTQKTGTAVVIPIHPIIRRMIDAGFDISTPITDQKINKQIKHIARMAGITQMVEATKIINHKAVVGHYPKCDVITTHTARRSAATNMYKAGIPSISIMKITGHTTEKAFMKYIKISAEENAELMAKNKFFMG